MFKSRRQHHLFEDLAISPHRMRAPRYNLGTTVTTTRGPRSFRTARRLVGLASWIEDLNVPVRDWELILEPN